MNSRIAFVTDSERTELWKGDQLAADELARLGITVEAAPWDDPKIDWARFAGVVTRSCWNYHLHAAAFRAWLDRLEALGVPMWNSAALIRWNMNKLYLRELQERGVQIVPTEFITADPVPRLVDLLAVRGWEEAVIKPLVSLGAHETHRVCRTSPGEAQAVLERIVRAGGAMVQPFLREVQTAGEWSLIFVAGAFSHAVLKRPGDGDFRVQAQHGGQTIAADPPNALVQGARQTLAAVPGQTLFARIDGIAVDGAFLLMEVELIEPDLFLGTDPAAARRLAIAIQELLS